MSEYVTTDDGTITLRDSETGELYHNRAGAFTEALQSYVEPSDAIARLQKNHQLALLDICFGLGYNTLVLLEQALEAGVRGLIDVLAIEYDENVIATTCDVIQARQFDRLRKFFGTDRFAANFGQRSMTFGGLQISIALHQADIRQAVPGLDKDFDFVYHDPFSPRKVPELWTIDLFQQYRRLLDKRQGAVLTYSAAGAVRGGLQQAGFTVYKTTPVGGKRGGTLASVLLLEPMPPNVAKLSDEEAVKLQSKSGIPYRDAAFGGSREDIIRMREAEQATYVPARD